MMARPRRARRKVIGPVYAPGPAPSALSPADWDAALAEGRAQPVDELVDRTLTRIALT
jgi:hypothetical protein